MAAAAVAILVTAHYRAMHDLTTYSESDGVPDFITVDLLTVSPYNRPGIPLRQVNGVVIHYTANPGTTAKENRDYFEGLSKTHTTKASAHFIVGLQGEVIQCIPTKEIAYASNSRNSDTIAIEVCYKKSSGKFEKKTYWSAVRLTAWLCQKFDLSANQVIRHYDVTGKLCPKYYVEHPSAWKKYRSDTADMIRKLKKE